MTLVEIPVADTTPVAARRPVASVVLPAHNAAATIGQQLEALADQEGAPSFETIVVANRCTDDTTTIAKSFSSRLPDLSVLIAGDLASASYARNVGAAHARGNVVLFCDADDEVQPDWVAAMTEALEVHDVVGGAIVPMDGSPEWVVKHFGPPAQ